MTPDPLAPFCERHGLTLEQREELRAAVRDVVRAETADLVTKLSDCRRVSASLAHRVAAQAELLRQRAERP